jgi:hypothetical protein
MPTDRRAEDEDLQMPRGDVLAHRLGRRFSLSRIARIIRPQGEFSAA